jgi:pSer/pThr/pTyr-binding forkhead associated (FHA) protein
MSYLEVGGRRYPIQPGETTIGSDAGSVIVLTGVSVAATHAVINARPDGQVDIRKADDMVEALVNGVRLGAQPTPLLHGDRVVLGGYELRYGDERRSGSTQFIQQIDPAAGIPSERPASQDSQGAVGSSEGRMVSLTDGREYTVKDKLVIGRAANCDIVLTGRNVSRRHAEIIHSPKGYLLIDSSTNGTFVNGDRVDGQRVLTRADVIRCGEDEFRFYAESAPQAEAPVEAPPVEEPPVSVAPPGAEHQLRDTLFGVPGVKLQDLQAELVAHVSQPPPPKPVPPDRAESPVLASLVVRSGALKGQRFAIRVPVANIGRAEYNDVVIPDDSVSTSHAKLQRREGIWVLVDLESTNGTVVDGERVSGEAPLAPGSTVQVGTVKLLFEPSDDRVEASAGGGTKFVEAVRVSPSAAPPPEPPPPAPAPVARKAEPPLARAEAPSPPSVPEPQRAGAAERPETSGTAAAAEGGSDTFVKVVWVVLALTVILALVLVFAG